MPPPEYLASRYYERWLWALERLVVEQGLLERDDRPSPTSASGARPRRRAPGRFHAGDRVRVRNQVTAGHTRVPAVPTRNHVGTVERIAFAWPNPGDVRRHRARTASRSSSYTVAFAATDLFGPAGRPHPHRRLRRQRPGGAVTELTPEQRTEVLERHLHDHGQRRPRRTSTPASTRWSSRWRPAADRARPSGARVVPRAWTDPEFRSRLLSDPVNHDLRVPPPDRADRRARGHARGAQRDRVHALLVLPERPARPPAGVVQELRVPQSAIVREPRASCSPSSGLEIEPDVELRVHDRPPSSATSYSPCGPPTPTPLDEEAARRPRHPQLDDRHRPPPLPLTGSKSATRVTERRKVSPGVNSCQKATVTPVSGEQVEDAVDGEAGGACCRRGRRRCRRRTGR